MKLSRNLSFSSNSIVLILFLLYFLLICTVNFATPPSYYNSDMYSDIILAEKMWNEKTLFPEDWIFGNQLYVIATPVLSAMFCGFGINPYLSMGLASTAMTIGIFLSFLWMLKTVYPSLNARLYGLVYFVGIVFFFGDAAIKFRGWQLFFTMCSYYACYTITVFLAFGCYLRSKEHWNLSFSLILTLTCIFSFATGIQSLRQTMVMTVPLIFIELLSTASRIRQKKPLFSKSVFVCLVISVSNLSGLLAKKFIHVNQEEIFGSISLLKPSQILNSIADSFSCILELFMNYSTKGILVSVAYLFLNIALFVTLIIRLHKSGHQSAITLLLLFAVSIGCIWGIDVISDLFVREIYYFMLYPFLALIGIYIYSEYNRTVKTFCLIALVALFSLSIPRHITTLAKDIVNRNDEIGYTINNYLEENEYTIAFSLWDFGDEIAAASKGNIQMQFWRDDHTYEIYSPLRETHIYNDDLSKVAYIFYGDYALEQGQQRAEAVDVTLTVQQYFAEDSIYVCTASDNLMQLYQSLH